MIIKFSVRQYIIPLLALLAPSNLDAQPYIDVAPTEGLIHTDNSTRPGGGVSFADFDGDGFDDLTLATAVEEPLQFYRNTPSGLQRLNDPTGNLAEVKQILWVDYDNDGDQDLFCSSFDGPVYLYRRDGDWSFTDVTRAVGFPQITKRHYGAAWGDYDRDGWLDLYYSQRKLPGQISQSRNRLFRNNADGTFSEVTIAAGVEDPDRIPFCIGFTDYNLDRWPDLYIANDRDSRNTLLRNDANGSFTDVSEASGAGIAIDAMNMGLADFDRDGDEDIYVTNIEEGSYLLRNDNGQFVNVAPTLGVGFFGIGWGASWIDGDRDGYLDLYVSGAIVGADEISSAYYRQEVDGTFSQPMDAGFLGDTVYSWSNAVGDYNRDNVPDILVLNQSPFASQLWSNTNEEGHYFELQLEGVLSNRDATGSLVEIFQPDHFQTSYTHCGSGFLAQQSRIIRFGLGATTTIDSVRITWPSGHQDLLRAPAADQRILLQEGSTTNGRIDVDPDVDLTIVTTQETFVSDPVDIYPNPAPAARGFTLQSEERIDYLLTDISGRLSRSGSVEAQGSTTIDQLPAGTYWIRFRPADKGAWTPAEAILIF